MHGMLMGMGRDPRMKLNRINFVQGVGDALVTGFTGGAFNGEGGGWLGSSFQTPPAPNTSNATGVGGTQAGLGTALSDQFANAMTGYATRENSIMNGNFDAAANAEMAGNVNAVNNIYDQNQGRIEAAGAGFGRSGNPATLTGLDLNNMGRASAVSGARGAMMNNAAQQYFNIINSGLGAGAGLLGNAANTFNKVSDVQQAAINEQTANQPGQIALGILSSTYGNYLKGGGGGPSAAPQPGAGVAT